MADKPTIRPGDLVLVDDAQTPLNPTGSTERGLRLVAAVGERGVHLLDPSNLRYRAHVRPERIVAVYRGSAVGDLAQFIPEEQR